MRFNMKSALFIALSLNLSSSLAASPIATRLNKEATVARVALERQYGVCQSAKDREINFFDFWLQAQSRQVKLRMIWELHQLAFNHCIQRESEKYTLAVVRLAAVTKDKSKLEEWLDMWPENDPDSNLKITMPMAIYTPHLQRLSASAAFRLPFDLMAASTAIIPNEQDIVDTTVSKVMVHQPYIKGLIPPPQWLLPSQP
jgi:hypothetical protein